MVPYVRLRVGDTEDNLYEDTVIADYIENNGIGEYNLEMPQKVALSGSGSSRIFVPELSEEMKQLLILFSARTILIGEKIRASRTAISFSNPVSNVNLTSVATSLDKDIDRLTKGIDEIKKKVHARSITTQVFIETLSKSQVEFGNSTSEIDPA